MKRRAFTLVELLVVIAIIALLLSILMPALRLAKDKAWVVYCGNNIKQQLIGFMLYGQDYNNKIFRDYGWLDGTDRWKYKYIMKYMGMNTDGSIVYAPQQPDGHAYAEMDTDSRIMADTWDTAPITQEDIKAPDVFYCPSNISRSGSRKQFYWDWDIGSGGRAPWRIIAFLWLLEDELWDGDGAKEPPWGNDYKIWAARLDVQNASEAELITDIAYSDAATGKFEIIISGGSGGGGPGMPESSSHIKSSEKLFGANIGFCDGSVRWRNFNDLKKRWRWGGINGSGPICWW